MCIHDNHSGRPTGLRAYGAICGCGAHTPACEPNLRRRTLFRTHTRIRAQIVAERRYFARTPAYEPKLWRRDAISHAHPHASPNCGGETLYCGGFAGAGSTARFVAVERPLM